MKFLKTLPILAVFLLLFATPVKADDCPKGPWYEQSPCQFSAKVKDGSNPEAIFGERYTYAQINWIVNSLATMFAPQLKTTEDVQNYLKKFLPTSKAPSFNDYAELGLPGVLLGGISESIVHPPASGVSEIKNLASRIFDLGSGVTPAYAQGYGYKSLQPVVQTLWSATRNMAYLLIVIILIAAGFLIMFRVKINPQTVVSLQTMIPKLIITLILVTFSFAIAGLVIDLIYVVVALFVALLAQPIGNVIHPNNLGDTIAWFTGPNYGWVVNYYLLPWILVFILGWINPLAFITGPILSSIAGISFIFLTWNLLKIWWMLVKAQVTLILLIAIGPLQIMLDLIPGQSGFGSWFRNILANVSVFATVPIMFLLNMLFWRPLLGAGDIPNTAWQTILFTIGLNPLGTVNTGTGALSPLPGLPFVSGSGFFFNLAVGYAILAMTPKIADIIRDALKVPAFKYGAAFGEAISPITKPVGGAIINYGKTRGGPISGGVIQAIGEQVSGFNTR